MSGSNLGEGEKTFQSQRTGSLPTVTKNVRGAPPAVWMVVPLLLLLLDTELPSHGPPPPAVFEGKYVVLETDKLIMPKARAEAFISLLDHTVAKVHELGLPNPGKEGKLRISIEAARGGPQYFWGDLPRGPGVYYMGPAVYITEGKIRIVASKDTNQLPSYAPRFDVRGNPYLTCANPPTEYPPFFAVAYLIALSSICPCNVSLPRNMPFNMPFTLWDRGLALFVAYELLLTESYQELFGPPQLRFLSETASRHALFFSQLYKIYGDRFLLFLQTWPREITDCTDATESKAVAIKDKIDVAFPDRWVRETTNNLLEKDLACMKDVEKRIINSPLKGDAPFTLYDPEL